jgi:hypothetical protein
MLTSAFVSCLDACLDAVGVRPPEHGGYKKSVSSDTKGRTLCNVNGMRSPSMVTGNLWKRKNPKNRYITDHTAAISSTFNPLSFTYVTSLHFYPTYTAGAAQSV